MISPTSSGTTAGQTNPLGGLSQNDFLTLMVAQLQNQDPLNPVSSDQFLMEMAAFTEVVDLQSLMQNSTEAQSVALIGKSVTAQSSGQTIQGTVSAVDFSSGQPMLTIGSTEVPFSDVVSVS